MPRDLDNPYGVRFRGSDRAMSFVHPYRTVGELSEVEQWKLARHPLEVADAVIAKYSVEGPGAIAKVAGETERLKWVGLYPQRQGGDAFMMRIKVPGGHMTAPQVREIGVVADAFAEGPQDSPVFGNRYADLTTRQDIQIHWIRIEDVPRIWARLWDVGITTVQACGDSARNVTACPVAGVDAEGDLAVVRVDTAGVAPVAWEPRVHIRSLTLPAALARGFAGESTTGNSRVLHATGGASAATKVLCAAPYG